MGMQGALQAQHEAHKARLARMGGVKAQPAFKPVIVKKTEPQQKQQIKSAEHYWRNMWFGNLVFDLPEPVEVTKERDLKIREVLEAVAEHFKTTVFLITSDTKRWCIGHPRQIGMYLALRFTKHSSMKIAQCFNRDHSTVLHGAKKIERKIETDLQVAADVQAIKRSLGLIA